MRLLPTRTEKSIIREQENARKKGKQAIEASKLYLRIAFKILSA